MHIIIEAIIQIHYLRQKDITGIKKVIGMKFYSKNKKFYSWLEKNYFFLLFTFYFRFFTTNEIEIKGKRQCGLIWEEKTLF